MRASHASSRYMEGASKLSTKSVKKEKWEKGLMVKGRNEPGTIVHVAHAVAKIKNISLQELTESYVLLQSFVIATGLIAKWSSVWKNSTKMFGLGGCEV
jgi:TatD DNase family protein